MGWSVLGATKTSCPRFDVFVLTSFEESLLALI